MNASTTQRRFSVSRGTQLHLLCSNFVCGLNLALIRIDKKTGKEFCLSQSTNRRSHDGHIANDVKTSLGRDLVGIFGDERDSVWPRLEGYFQHFFCSRHFHVEISRD